MLRPLTCGVYLITELSSGMHYVGQSRNIIARWRQHLKRFPAATHRYMILLECDVSKLDYYETACINEYVSLAPDGFNLQAGGAASERTAQARQNMSNGRKGIKFSDEHRAALSAAHLGHVSSRKGNPGTPWTDETRQKIMAARAASPRGRWK